MVIAVVPEAVIAVLVLVRVVRVVERVKDRAVPVAVSAVPVVKVVKVEMVAVEVDQVAVPKIVVLTAADRVADSLRTPIACWNTRWNSTRIKTASSARMNCKSSSMTS